MKLSKAKVVDAKDNVSKAISKMKSSGLGVLVFDKKKYIGIIDERQIRGRKNDPNAMKCAKLAIKTPVISIQDSIAEIADKFFAGRFKTLPVMDSDKLVGTMGRWDILKMVDEKGHLKKHRVKSYMTSPVITIDAAASVSVANALMREANVRRLAVLQSGELVGVISVFDLLPTHVPHKGKIPRLKLRQYEKVPVSSMMKTVVETIEPNATLSESVAKMIMRRRAALIVMESDRPIGIVTAKDILEAVIRKDKQLPVFVSGLTEADKGMKNIIASEGSLLLKKLKKISDAKSLSIHVKLTGREYYVLVRLAGSDKLRASASEPDIVDAIKMAFSDIRKQATKKKKLGMSKRSNKPFLLL